MNFTLKALDGIIFDMDGLLLDTETIALSSFVDTCRRFNYEPDIDIYVQCIGTTAERTKEILTRGLGPDFPYNAVREKWSQRYEEILAEKPVPVMPGAIALLDFLKQSKCRLGLATSTRYASAARKLESAGLNGYFSAVIGGDQVKKGKPDPEIYLRAAKRIQAAPERCLALEDSDNGVLAAYRAGLTVIQIPNMKPPSDEVAKLGHVILDSLEDLLHLIRR